MTATARSVIAAARRNGTPWTTLATKTGVSPTHLKRIHDGDPTRPATATAILDALTHTAQPDTRFRLLATTDGALCRGRDEWVSSSVAVLTEAAAACRHCPLLDPCRKAGTDETAGVWGGEIRDQTALKTISQRKSNRQTT